MRPYWTFHLPRHTHYDLKTKIHSYFMNRQNDVAYQIVRGPHDNACLPDRASGRWLPLLSELIVTESDIICAGALEV